MSCQPLSFTDTLQALDEILHLAVEKGLDMRDVTRFSAFVREQLVIRQEVAHLATHCARGLHRWVGPATGTTHCQRCETVFQFPAQQLVETHRAVRDGLIPMDPLDVAECPCDRHAPYFMDLAGINEAAEEVEG